MASKSCCQPVKKYKPSGLVPGILYGLLPHTFCIAFVFFSVLGATVATAFFKKVLLVPYFFQILVALSFVFATIFATLYLKRNQSLSWEGVKRNKVYLAILYGTTMGINLLFFLVIFPLATNFNIRSPQVYDSSNSSTFVLKVAIPCSGHAPLITDELKKTPGIENVVFKLPDLFDVNFDRRKITPEQILDLEIFQTFSAKEVSRG